MPAPASAPVIPVPSAPVKSVFSTPPATSVAPATPGHKSISAPLAALSENWPEALLREIAQGNLSNAQVALPLDSVASAMKRGLVTFAWRDLRSWIHPAPAATMSIHDNVELELPLKVIAPLFFQHQTPAARTQSRPAINESIPNLFSSFPSAETEAPVAAPAMEPAPEPAHPGLKPVDAQLSETNFYTWSDAGDTPRVDESQYKRPQTPGTDFTSRFVTPKEIVERAMQVPGVAGAVVALFDGLSIASQVPPDLNEDTVAAFLPQIFARTSQSTKELRMGELNNLSFTVGNVPWILFCVSTLYFAAFGRPGETLPTATLAALAGQLDRNKK
jgi:predicted regulator of Ras-like GTPase activity (Roadblock/LC7/MglB family)